MEMNKEIRKKAFLLKSYFIHSDDSKTLKKRKMKIWKSLNQITPEIAKNIEEALDEGLSISALSEYFAIKSRKAY